MSAPPPVTHPEPIGRSTVQREHIERRLSPPLLHHLRALLAQLPDPEGTLVFLDRYLDHAPPATLAYLADAPIAFHYLLLLFSHSRFLSETLVQQPELIQTLYRPGSDDIERVRTREEFREELARFRAMAYDASLDVILARFKRLAYLRIVMRDCAGLATLAETTLELSHLADVLLEAALEASLQALERLYGSPQVAGPDGRLHRCRLVILGLGKLGGQELNYSSDIDVMFLYDAEGQTLGGERGAVCNGEFFARLVSTFLRQVAYPGIAGTTFRVDLRLRPEGSLGDAAISLPAALHYYRSRARPWELQMLLKARPVAGDLDLGREFLNGVWPRIFEVPVEPSTALEAHASGTQRARWTGGERRINVKLAPGGIRDIEFLAQYLQRLHGGRDPWLASRAAGSTLVALQRLHDKGYLRASEFYLLAAAYEFLRHVEHRLQLQDGLQMHTLPAPGPSLDLIARRLGIHAPAGDSPGELLLARVERHLRDVRQIWRSVFDRMQQSPPLTERPPDWVPLGAPGWLVRTIAEHPQLGAALRAAGWESRSDLRRSLIRFLSAAVSETSFLHTLAVHPNWLVRIGELMAQSELLEGLLARHPEEARLVVEPDPGQIEAELSEAVSVRRPAGELAERLRVAVRRIQTLVAARAVLGLASPTETFAHLTQVIETAIEQLLHALAVDVSAEGNFQQSPFAVLALGRLASREFDFGSDADLVFVIGRETHPDQKERWRRLVEQFLLLATAYTRSGMLCRVDVRLRPRGAEGEILQSENYFQQYFEREAAGWEAVSFWRARAIAGNRGFGEQVLKAVRAVMRARFSGDGRRALACSLLRTHRRIEQEWKAQGSPLVLKLHPGAYHGLEYLLGYLAITANARIAGLPLAQQVSHLQNCGALEPTLADRFHQAAALFRSVDHAMRLTVGHSAPIRKDAVRLDRIRQLLTVWGVQGTLDPLGATEETCAELSKTVRTFLEQQVQAEKGGLPAD
jgi:glutamate-ammonia-ligase adenylyltransferase